MLPRYTIILLVSLFSATLAEEEPSKQPSQVTNREFKPEEPKLLLRTKRQHCTCLNIRVGPQEGSELEPAESSTYRCTCNLARNPQQQQRELQQILQQVEPSSECQCTPTDITSAPPLLSAFPAPPSPNALQPPQVQWDCACEQRPRRDPEPPNFFPWPRTGEESSREREGGTEIFLPTITSQAPRAKDRTTAQILPGQFIAPPPQGLPGGPHYSPPGPPLPPFLGGNSVELPPLDGNCPCIDISISLSQNRLGPDGTIQRTPYCVCSPLQVPPGLQNTPRTQPPPPPPPPPTTPSTVPPPPPTTAFQEPPPPPAQQRPQEFLQQPYVFPLNVRYPNALFQTVSGHIPMPVYPQYPPLPPSQPPTPPSTVPPTPPPTLPPSAPPLVPPLLSPPAVPCIMITIGGVGQQCACQEDYRQCSPTTCCVTGQKYRSLKSVSDAVQLPKGYHSTAESTVDFLVDFLNKVKRKLGTPQRYYKKY